MFCIDEISDDVNAEGNEATDDEASNGEVDEMPSDANDGLDEHGRTDEVDIETDLVGRCLSL